MLNRRRVLGVVVLLCTFASIAIADQPYMKAARTDLLQAKAQLQVALRNKAGHRARAIGYINSAIGEVNAGIRFDRRNNHASPQLKKVFTLVTAPDQVHMERALDHLQQAKSNLEKATSDKGGHRRNAIGLINNAIDEVKKGIEAGE